MTGQEIIDFARSISAGATTSQLTTADAVKYMNIGYHKIKREIINLKEDYFWDILLANTTAIGEVEYALPTGLSGNFNDVNKIMGVSIQYETTSDFIKATKIAQYELDHDLSYYETSQPSTSPFYFIAENSIFIYPAPLEAVTGGMKIYGIKNLIDIDENTTEANIFDGKIGPEYHYIISLYIRYLYYMTRGVDFKQDKIDAKNEFDIALREITSGLSQRDMSIIIKKAP